MRGQFRGYRDEPGVAKDSPVATYAALRLDVDSWRWAGVPFYVRAGKNLEDDGHRSLRRAQECRRRSSSASRRPSIGNYVRFRLGPQVAIALGARAKRPGEGMTGRPVELVDRGPAGRTRQALGDYERLLGDAMAGDATLFARQDVVEAAWAIVDPLLQEPGAMFEYEPGIMGTCRRPTNWSLRSAAGTRRPSLK